MLNIDEVLTPVSADSPCGPDLYDTGELLALEDLATLRPVTVDGDKRAANDDSLREPNWGKVAEMCEARLRESRDLRVAGFYLAACSRIEGFPGFARALDIMRQMLEKWDYAANPRMNPAQSDSVRERLGALVGIAAPYKREGDLLRVREALRKTPLVTISNGTLSYAQILAARKPDGSEDVALISSLRDAWNKTNVQKRDTIMQAIAQAKSHLGAIESWITNRLPSEYVPSDPTMGSVLPLIDELNAIIKLLNENAATQMNTPAVETTQTNEIPMENPPQAASGEIRSREDAIRMLGQVRDYLQRVEPTCPANFFIDRAIKLVGKNFLEALADLMPDATAKFEELAGILQADEKKDGN